MLNDVSLFKWLFIVAVTIIIKGERIPQYPSRELAININQGTSINGITGPRKRMKTVYTGVCVSHSVMSMWPHGLYGPWNSPGQNTGMGSYSLLQGIFPTQGSNPVSCIAGRFFTIWATRETQGLYIFTWKNLPRIWCYKRKVYKKWRKYIALVNLSCSNCLINIVKIF